VTTAWCPEDGLLDVTYQCPCEPGPDF